MRSCRSITSSVHDAAFTVRGWHRSVWLISSPTCVCVCVCVRLCLQSFLSIYFCRGVLSKHIFILVCIYLCNWSSLIFAYTVEEVRTWSVNFYSAALIMVYLSVYWYLLISQCVCLNRCVCVCLSCCACSVLRSQCLQLNLSCSPNFHYKQLVNFEYTSFHLE